MTQILSHTEKKKKKKFCCCKLSLHHLFRFGKVVVIYAGKDLLNK